MVTGQRSPVVQELVSNGMSGGSSCHLRPTLTHPSFSLTPPTRPRRADITKIIELCALQVHQTAATTTPAWAAVSAGRGIGTCPVHCVESVTAVQCYVLRRRNCQKIGVAWCGESNFFYLIVRAFYFHSFLNPYKAIGSMLKLKKLVRPLPFCPPGSCVLGYVVC